MALSERYERERKGLALSLMGAKAVLTAESDHPFVIERPGQHGGVERGFKLKLHETNPDAPLSPIYLNLRTPDNPKKGTLTSDIVDRAAAVMVQLQLAANLKCHAVVGVPRAGDPFARAFANIAGVPRLEMDKDEQGDKRRIAGVKEAPNTSYLLTKVLVLDDLATAGGSKLEAIQKLGEAGFEVADVLTLVDREQGAREELRKHGVTLHSVFTVSELLDIYVEAGEMTPYMRTKIGQYLVENS